MPHTDTHLLAQPRPVSLCLLWHSFLIAKYAGACDPLRTAISLDMCHLAFVPPHWARHVGVATQPCGATTCSISDYFFSWKYFRARKLFSLARCSPCCCCCCSHCFFCCSHCCCLFFQRRCWQLLFVKWSDLFVVTARRGVKTFSLYFFYVRNLFLRKFSASSRDCSWAWSAWSGTAHTFGRLSGSELRGRVPAFQRAYECENHKQTPAAVAGDAAFLMFF